MTKGQSTNEALYQMRVDLMTASNFKQAVKYVDDIKKKTSKSFMASLIGENRLNEYALPVRLKWGREKIIWPVKCTLFTEAKTQRP